MHDETHPSQISSGVSEVTAVSLLLVDLIRAIRFGATQSSVTCAKPVPEVTSPPPARSGGQPIPRSLTYTPGQHVLVP